MEPGSDSGATLNRVRSLGSVILTALGAVVIAAVAVVATPAPAGAHGTGGVEPSNYVTRITGVRPPAPGVAVRAIDVGTSLELSNTSDREVVVLGYDDEPYLRVGRHGVFENTRSPAVFLNRNVVVSERLPDSYDSTAPPEWHKISGGHTARWHDHRAHWMGKGAPPWVANDPDRAHVVIDDLEIPVLIGAAPATIGGDVNWIPGPNPWPWFALATGLAIALIAFVRTRWWPQALVVALATLIVTEILHVAGGWSATSADTAARVGGSVYSIAGVIISAVAAVWLARRDPRHATPLVTIAGLFMLIAGGFADVTSLTRSQLPFTWAPTLSRLAVASALGLGFGLMVVAGFHLRPAPRPSPATSTERETRDA